MAFGDQVLAQAPALYVPVPDQKNISCTIRMPGLIVTRAIKGPRTKAHGPNNLIQ
jgi:hypothetical protein